MVSSDTDASLGPAHAPRKKSPALAVLLSLVLPGTGQVYLGQTAKAVVIVMTLVGCLYGVTEGALVPCLFLLPFLYAVCVIDAYRWAIELNARALGGIGPGASTRESPWWGAALIALGLALLLHNLGWLDLLALRRFWPVILVASGAASLYGSIVARSTAPAPTESQRASDSY